MNQTPWSKWWEDQINWAMDNIMMPLFFAVLLGGIVFIVILAVTGLTENRSDNCPPPKSKIFSHWETHCGKTCYEAPVYNCVDLNTK